MSGKDTPDDDDFDLPAVDDDIVSTGAAADSSDWDDRLAAVPRILRYAMLVSDHGNLAEQRLVAEIDEVCPRLPQNVAWAVAQNVDTGLALAAELDLRAAAQDQPNLRSLADSARLLSLPTPRDATYFHEHRRVAKTLQRAFRKVASGGDEELCADLERFVFGWAALPACSDLVSTYQPAAVNAAIIGERMAAYRVDAAKTETMRRLERAEKRKKDEAADDKTAEASLQTASPAAGVVPRHHLVVARLPDEQMKSARVKDILGPLKGAINVALPLVEVPPLQAVRNTLLSEFPYAAEAIDFTLADLVGRTTVFLRPLILCGKSGSGTSFFARRVGEIVFGDKMIWRTDASRADSAAFAGTDRRWNSVEPCHPFLAIARSKIANPLILVESLDRAPNRSDAGGGRFWDCLPSFMDRSSSDHYPDGALQVAVNLSEISYIFTVNSIDFLPNSIRDCARVVIFPTPRARDLDALLPAVLANLARERGLDQSWVPPLNGSERAAVARYWRGGSVRRLRRVIEAILRDREGRATRN